MCHDALTCAVLYCVVDQVVLGIRILTELIWVLSSSCPGALLAQCWLQSARAGHSTSSTLRSDSVPQQGETIRANPNRGETHREGAGRNADGDNDGGRRRPRPRQEGEKWMKKQDCIIPTPFDVTIKDSSRKNPSKTYFEVKY